MRKNVDESLTAADEAPLPSDDTGGDPSCWLHLFCEDCGVQLDGTAHHLGCALAT